MTPGNWGLLGWFIGVPAILLALWVGQVGPAAEWGWGVVLLPWPMGFVVIFSMWLAGAFSDVEEEEEVLKVTRDDNGDYHLKTTACDHDELGRFLIALLRKTAQFKSPEDIEEDPSQ